MKRVVALLCVSVLFLVGTACRAQPLSQSAVLLDTTCKITLYDGDEALLDTCFARIAADEQRWSKTITTNEVSRLNCDGAAAVSEDTAALLTEALTYSTLSNGAFDITAAPLTALWEKAEAQNALPTATALTATLACVGYTHLTVDGTTATLTGGAQIDLGAIAKGAIADRAAAYLRENGCTSALVDLGGNIVAVGSKTGGEPFTVGIADPHDPDALLMTVKAADLAVVTSGSYERGYTIGDKRYSHILDPHTGQPVENDLASVTILCPSATKADALATACFVMGYDRAATLIAAESDTDAVFAMADGRVIATEGVEIAS